MSVTEGILRTTPFANVGSIQQVLSNMVDDLRNLGLPKLGPEFISLSGQSCVDSLVVHRLTKKFQRPTQSNIRSHKSVLAMLEYDYNGLKQFEPARMELDPFVRKVLYEARGLLHEVLSTFRLSYHRLEFPSGESIDSSQGDVSVLAKLRDKRHWKVTPECADLFIKVCYNNLYLKRCAKSHMPHFSRSENRAIYDMFKDLKHPAYHCFKYKMKKFVLTLWHGARLATVSKDNDVDRVIEVECMCNMIVQRAIALGLRDCFSQSFNVDLLTAQKLHKLLISDLDNATVDWRNASNSNWLSVVEWFFPTKVMNLLHSARSKYVTYYDTDKKSEYIFQLNMLSPMGNGFTFEVMTLFLMCVGRVLDSECHVFGDDVIIHRDVAENYIQCIESCGWTVNESKSFIRGSFRESCGGFYHQDIGYIRSYDLEWPTDAYDAMICLNKIRGILDENQVSPALAKLLTKYWKHAVSFCDALACRPSSSIQPCAVLDGTLFREKDLYQYNTRQLANARLYQSDALCGLPPVLLPQTLDKGYVVTNTMYRKLSSNSTISESLYKKYKKHKWFLDNQVRLGGVLRVPVKEPKRYYSRPVDNIKSVFYAAYYMYNGRVVVPTRGQPRQKISVMWWTKCGLTLETLEAT